VIKRHATDEGLALLESLEKMTTVEAVLRMIHKDMNSYVDAPLDEILELPEVQFVFDDIKLGKQAPTPPVLIVQAVHDKIVSVDDIDELAENYRAGGASVTYHRDMLSEHMLLHPMSVPMSLRWLGDRFARRALSEHLVQTMWPVLLNPSTYRGVGKLLAIAGRVITGRQLHRITVQETA
jgi:hypothetical protein